MTRRLEYPDVVETLFQLLDGEDFAGHEVKAFKYLTRDFADHLPAVHIYSASGQAESQQVFRIERVQINVYDEGGMSDVSDIAEDVNAFLVSKHHIVPQVGRLDRVQMEQTPHNVPYPDDKLSQCSAIYRVTVRPR